jgi:hypothetical protein
MDAKDLAQSRITRKSLLGKDQRDSMATAQAFCNICQSKVSANTMLTDNDLRRALDRDEDIRVMLVFVDEDDSSRDHILILSSQEKENLRRDLSSELV